jgi:hypothetical protein
MTKRRVAGNVIRSGLGMKMTGLSRVVGALGGMMMKGRYVAGSGTMTGLVTARSRAVAVMPMMRRGVAARSLRIGLCGAGEKT